MIIIAHRGNLEGPNPATENHPDQIRKCLDLGFNVEIDLWRDGEKLFLGHNNPHYGVDVLYLDKLVSTKKIWIHAKNDQALMWLKKEPNYNFFWHQTDNFTLTSQRWIWAYPGITIPDVEHFTIAVLPEDVNLKDEEVRKFKGVCTDYPIEYNDKFNTL